MRWTGCSGDNKWFIDVFDDEEGLRRNSLSVHNQGIIKTPANKRESISAETYLGCGCGWSIQSDFGSPAVGEPSEGILDGLGNEK